MKVRTPPALSRILKARFGTAEAVALALMLAMGGAACSPDESSEPEALQPTRTAVFIPGEQASQERAAQLSFEQLYEHQPRLLDGVDNVWLERITVDHLGMAHTVVQQTQDNIPVFSAQAIVHLDSSGAYSAMTDNLVRNIEVNTTPSITAHQATDFALDSHGGWGQARGLPAADLQILRQDGADYLTYRVQLGFIEDPAGPSMPVIFIDAHTGETIWQYNDLQTARDRRTYDARSRKRLPGTLIRTESQGPSGDAILDLAHDNAGITYNFYSTQLGRDSYNGAGATIHSTVHYDRNYVNAFWNGSQMVYGDGDGVNSSALVVLDVVGHELTHAVTSSSSNLVYSNESGALNEAMSDVFGAAIEAYRDNAVSANSWKIGEECWTPDTPGDALRYMNDPAAAGDRDYYPDRYTGTSDNGGVHTNSGIANLAFYLMVEGGTHPQGKSSTVVPALHSDAYTSMMMGAAIFYRANTVYLTSGSTFADARGATVAAAQDLYGSSAASAVDAAWDAVAVPVAVPPPPAPTWTVIDTRSNLSAGKNQKYNYSYVTPAGATAMKFELAGPNGDADLYVRFGSPPTTNSYDCRSVSPSSIESCTINPAQQGTYYVMINAYSAYNSLTFTASSGQ